MTTRVVTAENSRRLRLPSRSVLALMGLVGVAGYVAGYATDPASTSRGGGIIMDECYPQKTEIPMKDGDGIGLGVGDLSITGLSSYEDTITLAMHDGSLVVTDTRGDAEEYPGGDMRIITPGESREFIENDARVLVTVGDNGAVVFNKTCVGQSEVAQQAD